MRGPWPWMLAVVVLVGAWSGPPAVARAVSVDRITQQEIRTLDARALDRYLADLGRTHPSVPPPTLAGVVEALLHHRNPISLQRLVAGTEQAVLGDVLAEGRVLGVLLLLTVLAAVIGRLADAFAERAVADLAQFVVMAALVGVAAASFAIAVRAVAGMIGQLVALMEASIPAVVVLMASSGAVGSAGLFHPLLLAAVNLIAVVAQQWVLPLLLAAVTVEVLSAWMPRFPLSQLAGVLRQAGLFSLGGLLTLFLAVAALENVAGKMADSLALRTGKFLANAMIPVVGKMFSDAMDVVLRSSGLLLAALGLVAGVAVMLTVLFPLVKVLVMMLFFRLGAAGAEPLAAAGVSRTLAVMANGLGYLAATGAAVALMFFITLTVVVSAASGVAP